MAYPDDVTGVFLLKCDLVNGFGPFKRGYNCTFALKDDNARANLPGVTVILPGSTALVRSTGQTYMLEDDNVWRPF
jgi:hypothetical protein